MTEERFSFTPGGSDTPESSARSRADHIEWCKKRAREYLDAGDGKNAFASMMSDMGKHPETRDHAGLRLGILLAMSSNLSDMRRFIEGFN